MCVCIFLNTNLVVEKVEAYALKSKNNFTLLSLLHFDSYNFARVCQHRVLKYSKRPRAPVPGAKRRLSNIRTPN
jgi:hypothetical protein